MDVQGIPLDTSDSLLMGCVLFHAHQAMYCKTETMIPGLMTSYEQNVIGRTQDVFLQDMVYV